ncbi:MAG TPA: RDD family protein [Cyclobacteriaceae bacterium]|nr:RDD family protein [Cyclobacteriaceae bacterium]
MNNKNVVTLGYVTGIATIVSQLSALLPNPFSDPFSFTKLRNLFSIIWFDVFHFDIFRVDIESSGQNLNILILIGGIVMLAGTVMFANSNGREAALFRGMIAIVFLNSITGFVDGVFYSQTMTYRIALGLISIGFGYASYLALRSTSGTMRSTQVIAPKEKRALNWFIDITLQILVLSASTPMIVFFDLVEQNTNVQIALASFFLISRIIYYPLFEIVFKATPAKFFTQTKVLRDTDAEPDFINIIGRTLSRFIPFEPLSFFGTTGWHDSLSHTKVVNEVSIVEDSGYRKGFDTVIDQ